MNDIKDIVLFEIFLLVFVILRMILAIIAPHTAWFFTIMLFLAIIIAVKVMRAREFYDTFSPFVDGCIDSPEFGRWHAASYGLVSAVCLLGLPYAWIKLTGLSSVGFLAHAGAAIIVIGSLGHYEAKRKRYASRRNLKVYRRRII